MTKKIMRAVDALQEAQKIAFAPFIFQATVSLRKLGVLDLIFNERSKGGITIQELSKSLSVSEYGLGVLLEIAKSYDIVETDAHGNYELTKIGYFLNHNKAVEVNLNFTNDVCYQGLFHLNDAIKNGKPEGLKELGDWKTIYDGLSQLTPEVQKSWFEFDHHYSDGIFEEVLPRVFKNQPKLLFDIGANTGKFAIQCFNYDKNVNITIFDLPGQLKKALSNIKTSRFEQRTTGYEINWLHENLSIPAGANVIWMSQFLDCFSEAEIIKILKTCVAAMDFETELIIIETFTDRQKFDNAKFVLEATSLYFTVMANGNSKMYSSVVFKKLLEIAGLKITEDNAVGEFHTMLVCKK